MGESGWFYMLMGEYHYNLDDKGRLTIPSKLREELNDSCIITIGSDKQGRIKIKQPLLEYAKLEKECVIIGVSDHLEIWNKLIWDEFMTEKLDDLSDIADNLFGSNI